MDIKTLKNENETLRQRLQDLLVDGEWTQDDDMIEVKTTRGIFCLEIPNHGSYSWKIMKDGLSLPSFDSQRLSQRLSEFRLAQREERVLAAADQMNRLLKMWVSE